MAAGSGVDTITRAASAALAQGTRPPGRDRKPAGRGRHRRHRRRCKSAPDGHTLGVVSNNHVIFPSVLQDDAVRLPSTTSRRSRCIGTTPMVLVVNPAKVPATNAKELVALLKAKPDALQLRLGGQRHHPAPGGRDVPARRRACKAHHIPYKGVGPMVTDLIGGQVDIRRRWRCPRAGPHQERRAARHRHLVAAAPGRGTGDPDVCRAGPAQLSWWRAGLP